MPTTPPRPNCPGCSNPWDRMIAIEHIQTGVEVGCSCYCDSCGDKADAVYVIANGEEDGHWEDMDEINITCDDCGLRPADPGVSDADHDTCMPCHIRYELEKDGAA